MCGPLVPQEEEDLGSYLASLFSNSGTDASANDGGNHSPAEQVDDVPVVHHPNPQSPPPPVPSSSPPPPPSRTSSPLSEEEEDESDSETESDGGSSTTGPSGTITTGPGVSPSPSPPPPPSGAPSPLPGNGNSATQVMTRKEQLNKKFVTDYLAQKAAFNSADLDDEQVMAGTKLKDPMARNGADTATDVLKSIALLPDAAGKVTGFPGVIGDKDTSATTNAALGIASSGIGSIASTVSMFSNLSKLRHTRNQDKRAAAGTRAFAAGLDTFAGLASIGSAGGNIGLFGKDNLATKDGSVAQLIGGGLDIMSGTLSLSSNILKYFANRDDRAAHLNISERARKWYEGDAQMTQKLTGKKNAASTNIRTMKQNIPANMMQDPDDNGNGMLMKQQRTARHTAKARLYAMKQAAMMHKAEYENKGNNGIGLALAGLGSAGTILKGFSKALLGKSSGTLSLIGQVLGSVGTLGKTANLIRSFYNASDSKKAKNEAAKDNVKRTVVQEYIDAKADKIKTDADNWVPDLQETANLQRTDGDDPTNLPANQTISDEEAKRLAFLRLGIQVPRNADVYNDAYYKTAFEQITAKRANNILNSAESQKNGMLKALGLDEHATFNEVYTALCGGTV